MLTSFDAESLGVDEEIERSRDLLSQMQTEPLFGRTIAIDGAKAHSATHAP